MSLSTCFFFCSAQLLQHPVPGVYVLPSDVSPLSEWYYKDRGSTHDCHVIWHTLCNMSTCYAVWYGLLCVRGGVYQGAMFKFTILIPANYPDGGCPVSQEGLTLSSRQIPLLIQEFDFQAGVYHPLVDLETGELETKKEFQRWRRDLNHVYHLLTFARKIFYNIDTNHAANKEAAEL